MKLIDFNTATQVETLKDSATGAIFGKSISHFRIFRHRLVSNLADDDGYIVMMKQRLIIPNPKPPQVGSNNSTSYKNYPVLVTNAVKLTPPSGGAATLHGMFPRTLNSSVSTTSSSGQGTSTTQSTENTSGSANTNVNTFGVSLSGGFFGDVPMGSIAADYSHSWEKTRSQSTSLGHGSGTDATLSDMDTMSIKDWSSYGYVPDEVNPNWIWAQSYPWDVTLFNQDDGSGNIQLPQFVQNRLRSLCGDSAKTDKYLIMPPSQLSLFGLDFTMSAAWLVEFDESRTTDEEISISSTVTTLSAGHSIDDTSGSVTATLQDISSGYNHTISGNSLDLSEYALAPVILTNRTRATVPLSGGSFTVAPSTPADTFKIKSDDNNLLVTGSGFDADMKADFSSPVKITAVFKIADSVNNYALAILHAKGENSPVCDVAITVNGQNIETLTVQHSKSKDPNNNQARVLLRNLAVSDLNYHDYLKIGTNTLEISVSHQPAGPDQTAEYELIALALSLPSL